jgi:hypothetical protein
MKPQHVKFIPLDDMDQRDAWPDADFSLIDADNLAPPKFTTEALPGYWADWCHASAESFACPVDYVVASLLAFSSGWLGNSRRVMATQDWIEPPHLWFALIGDPSTGKTPAMRQFIEVSRLLEADTTEDWRAAQVRHQENTERAKAIADQWRSEVREATKDGRSPPDAPVGILPPAPIVRPRVMTNSATTEELVFMLSGNPRGLVLVRDELSGWLGDFDRYSNGSGDRPFYLESWNGGSYQPDRVKDRENPVSCRYTSLAIIGGLQPDKLREALSGSDDGLAARFLYVWPSPPPFRRLDFEHNERAIERRERLLGAARWLRSLTMDADGKGDPTPRIMRLDNKARALLDDVRREAYERIKASKGIAAGWHGKTPARALRLALVMEHLQSAADGCTAPDEVSGQAMARAAEYLDYATGMMERSLAGLAIDQADALAADIARLLVQTKPETVNERAIYQRAGFHALRNRDLRQRVFVALESAGFVRKEQPKAGMSGRHPSDWLVNPRLRGAR